MKKEERYTSFDIEYMPFNDHMEVYKRMRIMGGLTCIFIISTIIFVILWLAESQFSNGILRPRYLNEKCVSNDSCVKGLFCDKNKICNVKSAICSPYDDYYNYENGTMNPCGYPPEKCPPCDGNADCPPQYISRINTYFDYTEFPNYFINPSTLGFYKHDYNIPYGGCKELCANDYDCKAICYNPLGQICWYMKYYILPPTYNVSYTCAIKNV